LDRLKGCGTIDAPTELTQIKAKAFASGHFSVAFQVRISTGLDLSDA
jgi:hypothetical protein